MALSTQPYNGTRDLYPEDKRLQKYIFAAMRRVVEQFGYEEYDAPLLEPVELYFAKTGSAVVREQTYTLQDRTGMHLAIRPEMRPSASRMVAAKHDKLAFPLRWYSIPTLWRYERPQQGKLREYQQLQVEILGVRNLLAESEVIQVAENMLKTLGAAHDMYTIRLNSRHLMDFILQEYLGLDGVQSHTMTRLLANMHTMPREDFLAETDALFTPSQREAGAFNKLVGILKTKTMAHMPEAIRQSNAALELKELMHVLHESRITNIRFDVTATNGFEYYNGIIFEVFDEHPTKMQSLMSGGRFDGLVQEFGLAPIPAVGFSCDEVALEGFLKEHDLLPPSRSDTDVYIALSGPVYANAQRVVDDMRDMGANVAVDITGASRETQINIASRKGIHYIMFIGEKELKDEQYDIKNLATGVTERHSAARIVSIVKDYRGDERD